MAGKTDKVLLIVYISISLLFHIVADYGFFAVPVPQSKVDCTVQDIVSKNICCEPLEYIRLLHHNQTVVLDNLPVGKQCFCSAKNKFISILAVFFPS
jgi:hypothetical protein